MIRTSNERILWSSAIGKHSASSNEWTGTKESPSVKDKTLRLRREDSLQISALMYPSGRYLIAVEQR